MNKTISAISVAISLTGLPSPVPANIISPELMLAEHYKQDINVSEYWVSEKLDGVRARWTGKQLVSRGGNIINAPTWFIKNLPEQALDGELWAGRGNFELVSSAVRRKVPDEETWRKIQFKIFDLPHDLQIFDKRVEEIKKIIDSLAQPHITPLTQFKINSKSQLLEKLEEVNAEGGEGLMLHHTQSLYQAKRSFDLQKLKKYQDQEAKVIAHLPGKGRLSGLMGSLLVENKDGIQFKIGSGFKDAQRRTPPPVGSKITYRFRGKTKNGIPRFATFLREYVEL